MDRSTHVWWYSCTNPHICLEVHPSAGLLADEEPAQVEVGMVLGNVASSPLLDGTRSIQLSSISSTPYRTPCGPQLRFGRRITSIERLGGSPLVPRLLSFHGSAAVRGMCRAWGERRDIHINGGGRILYLPFVSYLVSSQFL